MEYGGKPTFPNATVRVEQKDVDFWLNPAHLSDVEPGQRHTFAESERSLRPVIDAGKLTAEAINHAARRVPRGRNGLDARQDFSRGMEGA